MSALESPFDRISEAASTSAGLDLLLLFGSRARGDAHRESDWDFGFLATPEFEPQTFIGTLMILVGTERVDLVDLNRAGGLLRFRAARDGRVVFERRPGLAHVYRLQAADFWCDLGPLLQQGYEDVLAGLSR